MPHAQPPDHAAAKAESPQTGVFADNFYTSGHDIAFDAYKEH